MTQLQLNNNLRNKYLSQILPLFEEDNPLMIASNEFTIPIVDEEGNEKWLVVSVKIPKEDFDGYASNQEYELKIQAGLERKRKAEELKAKKIQAKNKKKIDTK